LASRAGAATLLVGTVCFAGAAGAAPIGAMPQDPAASPVQKVDWRGGHWHGEWHPGWNRGWGWGGAGFGLGAAVGSALASPWYGYGYDYDYDPGYYGYGYGPGYGYTDYGYSGYGYGPGGYVETPDRDVSYCMSRFKSYDPASGTYLGYDGIRHLCP
jgi:hypothetical protein